MSYNPVNPNGQTTKSASAPVTLASDQNNALETGGNLATTATNTTGLNNAVGTTGSAVQSKGLLIQGSDGTDARNIKTDSSGNIGINLSTAIPTGSNTIGAVTQASGPWSIQGSSTGAAIPSNAVAAGLQARTSELGSQTSGDLYIPVIDKVGKQIVLPFANPENFNSGTNNTTGITSTSTSMASPPSGLKIYITDVDIVNTGANTTLVSIQNGSGGTTIYNFIAPAAGGVSKHFSVPLGTMSINTIPFFICGTASTTVYVSMSGYNGL